MRDSKVIISKEAPTLREGVWLKPVEGGYVMYILSNCKWMPLKIVNDKDTANIGDDKPVDFAKSGISAVVETLSKLTVNSIPLPELNIESPYEFALNYILTSVVGELEASGIIGTELLKQGINVNVEGGVTSGIVVGLSSTDFEIITSIEVETESTDKVVVVDTVIPKPIDDSTEASVNAEMAVDMYGNIFKTAFEEMDAETLETIILAIQNGQS